MEYYIAQDKADSIEGTITVFLSISDAWKMVTEKVQDARSDARMKPLSFSGINGMSMFGLNHDAIIFLLEQLCGAENCRNYQFKYHEYERGEIEEEPEVNPSGCARAEPFISRRPFEMFSFLLSRYILRLLLLYIYTLQ